jgi:hypothetical protein
MNDSTDGLGSVNQLFTVQNYMLNSGMLNFLQGGGSGDLLEYHAGLDYLDTLNKYTVSAFA